MILFNVIHLILILKSSLIVQLVKNPPAIQKTLVQFLGQEDLVKKGQATHSSILGFPCGSADKESAHNAGDLGSIPGLGRSPGEGKGQPVQYSWASHMAQLVKNPPAMWETWVRCLGWEDHLEKGKATHSSILAQRIPWTVQIMGSQRVEHD